MAIALQILKIVNKGGSSGNNINDRYAKLYVSDATETKYQSIQSNFKN